MKHLKEYLFESILDTDDETIDNNMLQYSIETETGWTLSSDGKYILSGTKHFPAEVDTQFGKNKEWFEKLVNCAKKYKLKIQPFGLLVLDSDSIHLLEGTDIEYICDLKIQCKSDPINIDLSKIKSPIHRLSIVDSDSNLGIKSITLPKSDVKTATINISSMWVGGLENIKNQNCENLIVLDSHSSIWNVKYPDNIRLQQLVNNNPNVTNFYLKQSINGKTKYYQIKLKGSSVDKVLHKTEVFLTNKGILEDFYTKNGDYKQWYEKHM